MKEKTDNIDILEEPKDILFEIDMKLYDEFNDKFCEIEENLGTVYSYKDLEDLKKAESDTERTLLREAISTLIAENKELKEEKDSLKKEVIHWKGEYHLENRKYLDLYNKKVSIPKINATEEMLEQYVEKIKIIKDIEELEDYIQHSANPLSIDNSKFAIKILQSLLGKE